MKRKNAIRAIRTEILEMLKKYPELSEVVDEYLKTAKAQDEMHLSADAEKALKTESGLKPLESLFHASVGSAEAVPDEVLDVIKKYPDFEESVNTYLRTMYAAKTQGLSIDAVKMMESQAHVKAIHIDFKDVVPKEIMDVIKLYPNIEQELNEYLDTMKKEQELNLSVDAVKMLEQ